MSKTDTEGRFRAFGRILARDILEEEMAEISGACGTSTATSTWRPEGDDKDTDCDEETQNCTSTSLTL